MPSKNRIAAYPSDAIRDRLKDFAKEQGLTESKALIQILNEYFGMTQEVIHRYVTVEQLQSVEKQIEDLRMLVDDIRSDIPERPVKGQLNLIETLAIPSEPLQEADAKKDFVNLERMELSSPELSIRLGKNRYYALDQRRKGNKSDHEISTKLQKLDPDDRWWEYDPKAKKWISE